MSRADAPGFKSGQKSCCNCHCAQFGGGSDDFKCLKYGILFSGGTVDSAHYKCRDWKPDEWKEGEHEPR